MPIKSSLQNKYSDLVTKVGYFDPKNYSITLKSTLDNSLDHVYYNDLTLKYFTEKSEFNLNFYEKNNHIGNERFTKGNFKTNITDNTLLIIETARNLKTDFTNFNKLAIENENECIRYGLYLQRNYSDNNDLKPSTSIFFGITLLPFAENYTSGNLVPSIGGRSLF
jgi:hypothetical protein